MGSNKYAILQSGFLAWDDTSLVKPDTNSTNDIVTLLKVGKVRPAGSEYFYHQGIQDLYDQYIADGSLMAKFEFREKILKAAFEVFVRRGASFTHWLSIQTNSPFLTGMHRRFIIDTLQFLASKSRSVQMESWQSMVSLRAKTPSDEKTPYNWKDFFVEPTKSGTAVGYIDSIPTNVERLMVSTIDVIRTWTAIDKGFVDLLCFMHLVFGKRQQTAG